MSKVLITESYLEDIADAIRIKNGSQNTYTPSQMSSAISTIPIGATNFVTGTFTTSSSVSTNGTVTVPYTGNGYPILLVIIVDGGMYNPNVSEWYDSLTRYAIGQIVIAKGTETSTPSYGTSGAENYGTVELIYKNSTSSSTTYSSTRSVTANSYSSSNANGTSYTSVRWKNKTSISYRTGGGTSSTYGLLAGTTYRYYAIYSN